MNPVNRATVVIKVDGQEVARRQVRVEDGTTVEIEVPGRDVAEVVRKQIVKGAAQFRATTGGK